VTVRLLVDPWIILKTGNDGRFCGVLTSGTDIVAASFSKDGYGGYTTGVSPKGEYVLKRKFDWGRVLWLPYEEESKLDRNMQELLSSDDWSACDEKLLGVVFEHQRDLRPALRRLISDAHVGAQARDWLELLGDPADSDLYPKGRRYAPQKKVEETDLVEALRSTARLRNFFSSCPKPMLDIDLIAFTPDLDRAFVQCGINRVALTGITWQFVFRKVGKQWELHSAKEAGRS
jgi:hypothetical protein